MADLAGQADDAVQQKAQLVLVLMGANDLCAREGMTSVDDFRAAFDRAAQTLRASGATVLVLSAPDVVRLWALEHDAPGAQRTWDELRECPRVLSSATSNDTRADAATRLAAYESALREESARFGFAYDDGALANATFTGRDLSPIDHFHPSLDGQARLADLAWRAGPFANATTTG